MGTMIQNFKQKALITSQNNLLYIVSYHLAHENIILNEVKPLTFCHKKIDDKEKKKEISNYPLISYKFDFDKIKYTKYEYRQMKILQMIMLTPDIFISITDTGIQVWYDSNGIKNINCQFFDILKNEKKCDFTNKNLIKFDEDLFYIKFNLSNDIKKMTNFYIFSAKKIIQEGKITELYKENKYNIIFPINNQQILTISKNKIKIFDIMEKKLIKTISIFELMKFNISYGKHLFNDIIIFSSDKQNKSMIYSVTKNEIIYYIPDKIEIAFNLGKNRIIIICKKVKELLIIPDLYSLSLEKYETDIFNSIEDKSFYSINEESFLLLNYKTGKLKKILINENNDLIVTKDIQCPNELIKFCPFMYTYENRTELLCSLFICNEQTYKILDNELKALAKSDDGNNYSSVFSPYKRLFLNYFEINTKEKGIKAYIPYSIIQNIGVSSYHIAAYKNKRLYELESCSNYFEPNIKMEIVIDKKNNKDLYVVSLIKNMFIYIIKINEMETSDKLCNYNFGNIRTKGIVNLNNNKILIYFDKKSIIIDVIECFTSKINPLSSFLFTFVVIYAVAHKDNLILVSNQNIYLFDYREQKIIKQMKIDFDIILDDNLIYIDINIIKLQLHAYILIVGINYLIFDDKTFTKIINLSKINLLQKNILFFKSSHDYFEIINKNIETGKNIKVIREKTDEQKHKMKYLSKNRMFVGIYPNKFYIFE